MSEAERKCNTMREYYVTTSPRIDRRDTVAQLKAVKSGEIPGWSEMFTSTLDNAVTLIEEMAWREETGLWEEDYTNTNETVHKAQ